MRRMLAAMLLAFSLVVLSACDALGGSKASVLLKGWSDYPAYAGEQTCVVNDNEPFFAKKELSMPSGTEVYGRLDKLGRCTSTFAIVGPETMPESERGNISSVKPSGWQHVEYSFVDGKALYNRCHLIAWTLTGELANDRNLVTGTRSMNTAQVPYEQLAMNYVRSTGGHVAYRSTPVFRCANLVCDGILMEAYSLEDQGKSVKFCVFFYNVEPDVDIDYATGESQLAAPGSPTYSEARQKSATVTHAEEKQPAAEPTVDPSVELAYVESASQAAYALNVKTMKFHTASCPNIASVSAKNLKFTTSSRADVVRAGYQPSGCCEP